MTRLGLAFQRLKNNVRSADRTPVREALQISKVGVDLRLGAIDMTNVNKFRGRRREEQLEKVPSNSNISNI